MHIALFHNVPSGGAKRAVYEWTRRLGKEHRIDVFTVSSADQAFCDIRPFVERHRVFDFSPSQLFDSPWGRLNQLQRWRDLGELADIGQRIAGEINASGYDVVFANTCMYTFIPAFLKWVRTPSIYYLHEPFGRTFTRQFQRPYLKYDNRREVLNRFDPLIKMYRRRLDTMQLESLRHTKLLLANSLFTQEHMNLAFEVDTPVCHYGVDCENFRPISGLSKENSVISVGELSPRKGFDFVVESLGRIPAKERPTLKIACNSVQAPERAYIEALANQCGVDLRIITNLNMEELAIHFGTSSMCVYAPVSEPFGLVPLEAMSCGTPVVGVREGGVQESIIHERTGLLVERDPDEFAGAVRHLLSNPTLAAEYGCYGREYVLEEWTWDQSTAALESYLTACADSQDN